MHRSVQLSRAAHLRGASLVETLVAALVLALGVLGTAVLLAHGLRANRSALLRTQAVMLAADLAERIRANPAGRAAYAQRAGAGAGASRAAADLAQWRERAAAALPAPRDGRPALQVQFLAGAPGSRPDRYRLMLAWSEPGSDAVWTQQHLLDLLPRAP